MKTHSATRTRGRLPLLALVAVLLAVSLAARPPEQKSLVWEAYNVAIEVQPSGDLLVTETQRIRFTSGTFTFGYAAIPLGRTAGIDDVQVSEDDRQYRESNSGQPYTFRTEYDDQGNLAITWYFPATANSTHNYILRYTARRSVLVYPIQTAGRTCGTDGDVVDWNAIPEDHNFPIREALVTLSLPAPVMRDEQGPFAQSYGADANLDVSADGRTLTWGTGSIPAGEPLEVCAIMPAGTITTAQPPWQRAEIEQAARDSQAQFWSLLVALPLLCGGPLLVLALYYTRGRDPEVGAVAEYLSDAPSDLPPGAAGTLIDESADLQDVLATMVDLARRGYLDMQEQRNTGLFGMGTDFVFHRLRADNEGLRPHEVLLLDKIFGGGSERRLSELKQRFYVALPELKRRLYEAVVAAGLFPASPESVRGTYYVFGGFVVLLAIGVGVLGAAVIASGWVLCPAAALGLLGVLLFFVAQAMPKRTRAGAEEAAKWRAFKRYLQNLEKYTDVQAAKDQFERYLPYAIAFGLERSWIARFARVPDVRPPIWYYPWGVPYGSYGRYGRSGMGGAAQGAGGRPVLAGDELGRGAPSMGDISTSMAGGLQSMSDGLVRMLNTAGSTFTSTPPSQSSGGGGFRGGGGGFSGGGGGGGGSRGFG